MSSTKWLVLATYTLEEQLRICEQCAMTIMMAGQHYEIGGQIFERADLAEVNRRIEVLKQQINTQNSGGGFVSVVMRKGRFN